MNIAEAYRFGVICFAGVAQIISYLEDEESVLVVLVIFCLPALLLITHELVNTRIRYVSHNYIEIMSSTKNVYLYGLTLRYRLYKYLEAKSQNNIYLMEALERDIEYWFEHLRSNFGDTRLIFMWKFQYFYYIKRDITQAGLKLYPARDVVADLETSFLHYKYLRMLNENAENEIADIELLRYLELYEEAKHLDSELCIILVKFWDELLRNIPRFDKLESFAIKLHKALHKSIDKSRILYEKYPNNRKVCNLYGSFLSDIYNEQQKGQEMLLKVESLQSNLESRTNIIALDQITYIDENIGVMLISGEHRSLGIILFINHAASILLGYEHTSSTDIHFSDFCPPPFNDRKKSNDKLEHYLEHTKYSEIPLPPLSFVINKDGYLIEVYLEVRCLAYNSSPIFICSFKRLKEERECALISDHNIIKAHTKGFKDIIGDRYSHQNYIDIHIQEVQPELERIETDKVLEIYNHRDARSYYAKLELRRVGSIEFRILHISYGNMNECNDASIISKFSTSELNEIKKSSTILNVIFDSRLTMKRETKKFAKQVQAKKIRFDSELDYSSTDEISPLSSPKSRCSSLEINVLEPELISEPQSTLKSKSYSQSTSNYSAITSFAAVSLMNSLKRSIFKLKLSTFITILSILLGVISITIYVFHISSDFQHLAVVHELSEVRNHLIIQSANVRLLQISNIENTSEDTKSFLSNLTRTQVYELDEYLQDLEKKIDKWDLNNKEYFNNKKVKVWYLADETQYYEEIPVLIAIRNLVRYTISLTLQPIDNITQFNPEFYYTFRNGHGETLSVLNETVSNFINKEKESLQGIVSVVELLCASVLIVIFMCSAIIFIPSIITLERCHKSLWEFYLKLESSSLYQLKVTAQERLVHLHSIGSGLHFSDEETDFGIQRGQFSYRWRVIKIILKLSLSFLVSIAFLLFFYYWISFKYVGILEIKPNVENWAGMRRLALQGSYFWYYERLFDMLGYGYTSIVPEFSTITSLENELMRYADLLQFSEYNLVIGNHAREGMDRNHYNIILEDARNEQYNNNILAKGAHSGISEYLFSLGDLEGYEDIYNNRIALGYICRDLAERYQKEFKTEIEYVEQVYIWVVVIYCIFSILIYFLVYVPVINYMKKTYTKIWELSRLIPASMLENHNKL